MGNPRLIAEGADVGAKEMIGLTPLHLTAMEGHQGVAELLIAEGASVNAKGSEGLTRLHWAAKHGSNGVAELLTAAEAPD